MNDDEFKTTVNKKTYDLKNAKKFLVKITTQKVSENEAHELYSDLITSDIIELEKTNGRDKNRRYNILNVLKNSESVFTGANCHYKDVPSESEEKSKKESDQSVPIWVEVSEERFNVIKQIINENKDLGTTKDGKIYTLIDANDLVNKIAKKKIGKNKAINFYNNLVKKAKQISELRST